MSDKKNAAGANTLTEMKEFATFSAATQRYIRRSLDIAMEREDALERWSRDHAETASIRAQAHVYDRLPEIRALLPETADIDAAEALLAPLISVAAFDLAQARLPGFQPFRFLYERLIGAEVRPWLPSAFCAAAALPLIHPDLRRTLLQSISEAAATASGWSSRQPLFYPQWVEKIDPAPMSN